jgi:hypothetical protein
LKPGSTVDVAWAREVLARAQTVEQLRQAQAVVRPLDYGLSLEQTARAIGRSVPWTCRLRNRDPLAQQGRKKLPERLAQIRALWPGQDPAG